MITWNTSSVGVAPEFSSSRCSDAIGRRLWPLNSGRLCAAARLGTGLKNFGDSEIALRLDVLTNSLNHEANLHAPGRFFASMHLGDLLKTRLLLENTWRRAHGMNDEPIDRPIFITGMPRSGSTFLQELLAQDPGHRVPRVWEIMLPLPSGGLSKPRIWRTGAYLWAFRQIAPRMDSIHPIRANTPHECMAIHSYTMLSREFVMTFKVPSYEAFLDTVDFTPAYLWQKRFLQHLQLNHPRRRWILKAPDHVFSLGALLRVFPDATIIQTHRNPLDVVNSSCQLVDALRRTFAWPEEQHQLRIREADAWVEGTRRIARFRAEHPELADRFLDVNYDELIADPAAVVGRLYEQLNLQISDTTVDLMRALARGRCHHDPTTGNSRCDFGVDPAVATGPFADYTASFGILRPEQDA